MEVELSFVTVKDRDKYVSANEYVRSMLTPNVSPGKIAIPIIKGMEVHLSHKLVHKETGAPCRNAFIVPYIISHTHHTHMLVHPLILGYLILQAHNNGVLDWVTKDIGEGEGAYVEDAEDAVYKLGQFFDVEEI